MAIRLGQPLGVRIALLLLALVVVGRVALTYPVTSATVDEARHIAAGVEAYQTGAFTLYYWSPALPRYFHGLLPYLAGTRLREGTVEGTAGEVLGPSYWATLTLARIGTLAFVPILLGYSYLWSARLYGRKAGLAAAALVSLSPTVIAHASLATVDVPSAATILAATFHFWRYSERPSWHSASGSAAAFAAAVLCKSPALLQLSLILILFLAIGARRWRKARGDHRRSARNRLFEASLFATTSFVIVWAAYRFAFGPLGARPGAADSLATNLPLPMPAYLDGLVSAWLQAREGGLAFLLGEVRTTGWWYYFPVALALKTTFPLLILLALAAWRLLAASKRGPRRRSLYPVLVAIVLLGVAMTSRVNIGVRHVLPVEAMFAVLGSAVLAGRWRHDGRLAALPAIGLALLGWHALESAAAHPHYIAYFNPIARGREWQFLGNSDLDWGQDLARLALYLDEHDLGRVSVCALGAGSSTIKSLGITNVHLVGVGERPSGWLAVSTHCLQGLWPKDFRWLQPYRPAARIGKSIFLYRVPARERGPLSARPKGKHGGRAIESQALP